MGLTRTRKYDTSTVIGEIESKVKAKLNVVITGSGLYITKKNKEKNLVASINLEQFPSCCGAAVISNLWVSFDCRRSGIGTLVSQIALHLAHEKEYGLVLATDILEHNDSVKIAKRLGTLVKTFTNPKTTNKLYMYKFIPRLMEKELGFVTEADKVIIEPQLGVVEMPQPQEENIIRRAYNL